MISAILRDSRHIDCAKESNQLNVDIYVLAPTESSVTELNTRGSLEVGDFEKLSIMK